jgi:hypothetical protein
MANEKIRVRGETIAGKAATVLLDVKESDGVFSVATSSGVGDLTNDAWGISKVSMPTSLYSSKFTYDIDPAAWFMFENGVQVYTSTNITSTDSAGKLVTDATNTVVYLESRECPRYQPNRGHLFSVSLWCPNKVNDGIREWGVGVNGENEVNFVLKSDGLLYAKLESGGVVSVDEVIDTSGVAGFDVEKGNLYDIQFQWRGVGNYKFFINNVLVHTIDHLGTLTALSMENPALPAHFRCERTTENVEMHVGCVDITSENGSKNDREAYVSVYAEAVSVGSDSPVLVLYNPLQINSQTNTRTATLARISFNCSKKAVFKVWLTRNPADITGETLKVVGEGSYTECDSTDMDATAVRATAVTVANLQFVTSVPVEATKRISVDNPYRDRIEFPIVRGDYLIITCTAATASADCVVELGEQR